MIANLISYFISSRLQEEPIYEALQHQDGIRLSSGARAREDLLMVGHAYRSEPQLLAASERIRQALASVDREFEAWPVVDEAGFRGMVTANQLEEAIRAGRENSTLAQIIPKPGSIEDLLDSPFPPLYPDDPLESAMRQLAGDRIRVLPVLSRMNPRELKGTITFADVVAGRSASPRRATRSTWNTKCSPGPIQRVSRGRSSDLRSPAAGVKHRRFSQRCPC